MDAAELHLILAMANGLQHALAIPADLPDYLGPIIFVSTLTLDAQTSAYMISALLIGPLQCVKGSGLTLTAE